MKTRAALTHPVIECFGPTLQGEGALIGQPVHFVRFGGCDYRCSWCDSMYAVDPIEVKANAESLAGTEIADRLDALGGYPGWVVLSGGNPALHHLDAVIDELHERDYRVTIETQGTVFRPWIRKVDKVTVSPKPPSSGNITDMNTVERFRVALEPNPNQLSYKVVVFDQGDVQYLRQLVRHLDGEYEVFASVGNDVGKDTTSDLLTKLEETANMLMNDPELAGVRVLPQLHVLLWGNARGV